MENIRHPEDTLSYLVFELQNSLDLLTAATGYRVGVTTLFRSVSKYSGDFGFNEALEKSQTGSQNCLQMCRDRRQRKLTPGKGHHLFDCSRPQANLSGSMYIRLPMSILQAKGLEGLGAEMELPGASFRCTSAKRYAIFTEWVDYKARYEVTESILTTPYLGL